MKTETSIICDILTKVNLYLKSPSFDEKERTAIFGALMFIAKRMEDELSLHCEECGEPWFVIGNQCSKNCKEKL